jgi:hypothetical protein
LWLGSENDKVFIPDTAAGAHGVSGMFRENWFIAPISLATRHNPGFSAAYRVYRGATGRNMGGKNRIFGIL